jgi:hypothetical protein
MDKHFVEWLGPYMDGELQPALAQQVGDHLAECDHCRQELASLEELSGLLRSTPTPAMNTTKFRARLDTHLPARLVEPASHPVRQMTWWLIPTLVVVIALILQIASLMTAALLIADQAGLLGNLGSMIPGNSQIAAPTNSWASLLAMIIEGDLGIIFVLFESIRQSVDFLIASITWQFGLVLIYLAWLVAVWNNRTRLLATPAEWMKKQRGLIGV